MRYPEHFLNELKHRTRLSEIVSEHTKLKRAGRGEMTGCCPFHQEKTPSFSVNDQKGGYYCFGCGAKGNVFTYLKDKKSFAFSEAVEYLAGRLGMEVPTLSEEEQVHYQEVKSAQAIMELAAKFYQQSLFEREHSQALSYLEKRGLSHEVIRTFALGYAPEGKDRLCRYLLKQGADEKTLINLGLAKKQPSGALYDYFYRRVMFPIRNSKGEVIAFGGRILGDGQPKYLNSPETELFNKSQVLYNEDIARSEVSRHGKMVVVEGYMDVIALYAVGIKSAVAPLGTSLTEDHAKRLWWLVEEPVLCMDGDAAGQRAMVRAMELVLPILQPGKALKFAKLPQKMDPDDVIKQFGVGRLKEALQQADSLSAFMWRTAVAACGTHSPESTSRLERMLKEWTDQMASFEMKKHYTGFFRQQVKQLPYYHFKHRDYNDRMTSLEVKQSLDFGSLEGCEYMVAYVLLSHPSLLEDEDISHYVMELEFTSEVPQAVVSGLLEKTEEKWEALQQLMQKILSPKMMQTIPPKKLWRYAERRFHLAQLTAEYQHCLKQMTQESEARANRLRDEIGMLNEEIEKIQYQFAEGA